MARPREFDEAAALRAAMTTFWARGYEATSVTDLTESMGVSRSTLYASFGDKQAVFQRALDLYSKNISAERYRILAEAVSAREGLREFFLSHISTATDPRYPGGCLVVNTACESELPDGSLRERADRLENGIRELLVRARKSGELGEGKDVRALARMYTSFTYGIHVLARMGRTRGELEESIAPALLALEPE
jgi:TetR/AcrR family transcriptional repressor of nem operon